MSKIVFPIFCASLALLSPTACFAADDAKSAFLAVPLRINCGGPAVENWRADGKFVRDGRNFNFPPGEHDTSYVQDPAPEQVYDTVRHHDHAYLLPVAPGRYKVRLHFTDFEDGEGRHMEYWVNGVRILAHFDIKVWAGGARRAIIWEAITEVEAGKKLVVHGYKQAGTDVFQAGIEVLPAPADAPLTEGLLNTDLEASTKRREAIKNRRQAPNQ